MRLRAGAPAKGHVGKLTGGWEAELWRPHPKAGTLHHEALSASGSNTSLQT